MNDDDLEAWNEYVKFVKKLDQKTTQTPIPPADKIECILTKAEDSPKPTKFTIVNKHPRKREIFVDAKIDLHHLTQEQAYLKLKHFLEFCVYNRKKRALIITGKGPLNQPGVIRTSVPRWLQFTELKQYIVNFSSAPYHLGGEGAIYIILQNKI